MGLFSSYHRFSALHSLFEILFCVAKWNKRWHWIYFLQNDGMRAAPRWDFSSFQRVGRWQFHVCTGPQGLSSTSTAFEERNSFFRSSSKTVQSSVQLKRHHCYPVYFATFQPVWCLCCFCSSWPGVNRWIKWADLQVLLQTPYFIILAVLFPLPVLN